MSIIQEALKKAQGDIRDGKNAPGAIKAAANTPSAPASANTAASVSRAATVGTKKQPRSGRDPKAVAILLILLVATAILAANQLFPIKKAAVPPQAGQIATREVVRPAAQNSPSSPLQSVVFQQPEENKPVYPELLLNGIMYLEGSPRAIINDAMVEIGDVVSGAKLMKIDKRNVTLQYNDSEIVLTLN